MKFDLKTLTLEFAFFRKTLNNSFNFFEKNIELIIFFFLIIISIVSFLYFNMNGLDLIYNDTRSHLNMGRRVVDNLKPGFAQLGAVWLPLPHLLMLPTIWNDFMWHSGLSGAIQSMISYVATGLLIYQFLKKINVGLFGRLVGVSVFASNINVLYLQSTAMTELLLLSTMTAGVYELILWHKEETMQRLVKAAFWIMLSTLIRYDGWFLFIFALALIFLHAIRRFGLKTTEGVIVLFCTLGGFGIFLWLLWNQMIFKDALYFVFGPYSANSQQKLLELAGVLHTKNNLILSSESYMFALIYNAGFLSTLFAIAGGIIFWFDRKIDNAMRFASVIFLAPVFFNVSALYFGHSVMFIQGFSANSWFNVRYGLMMVPVIAIFAGYFIDRLKPLRFVLTGLLIFVSFFTIVNRDSVVIDDGRSDSSGYDVSRISNWLYEHAYYEDGYVFSSTASHDEIMFSSGLSMKRFIHEGTGDYWDLAIAHPEQYVRWVIMRTGDSRDVADRLFGQDANFKEKFYKAGSFPYADIYELKPQYLSGLLKLPEFANR